MIRSVFSFLLSLSFLLGCLLTAVPLCAQKDNIQSGLPYFEVIRDVLPESNCTRILQDHNGYIWIGTRNGVTRYDGIFGHTFGKVDTREKHSDRRVVALVEDEYSNCIWASLGSAQILLRIDLADFSTQELSYSFGERQKQDSRHAIEALISLNDSILLVRTIANFYTVNKKTGASTLISLPPGRAKLAGSFIRCGNRVFAASGGDIYELKQDDGAFYGLFRLPGDYSIVRRAKAFDDKSLIVETADNFGGIGSRTVYSIFSIETGKLEPLVRLDVSARDFCVADDGIWVTSLSGLRFFRFADNKVFRFSTANSDLQENRLAEIIKVRNQPVFYFCSEDGLIKMNYYASKFHTMNLRQFSESDFTDVFSAYKDSRGGYWAWCIDGLFKRTAADVNFQKVPVPKGISEKYFCRGIKETYEKDKILFSMNYEVLACDLDGKNFRSIFQAPKNSIIGIQTFPDHKALVYCRTALYVLDTKTGNARKVNVNLTNDISAAYSADCRTAWLVDRTYTVFSVDLETGQKDNNVTLPGIGHHIVAVRNVRVGGLNEVWVCCSNTGIYYFNAGYHSARRIDEDESIVFGAECMECDTDGNIWVANDYGISCISDGHVTNYSNTEYSIIKRFCQASIGTGSEGEILFGGHGGFVEFTPSVFSRNTYFPEPRLASYKFSNAVSDTYDEFTATEHLYRDNEDIFIPAGIRSVQLFARSLNYDRPLSNVIDWKMDDEDQWHRTAAKTSITLTNLSGGQHTLLMKTVDMDGNQSSNATVVKIFKETFLYEKPWFLLFCATILILIGVAVVLIRANNARRLREVLEAEVCKQSNMLKVANKELRKNQSIIKQNNLLLEKANSELEQKVLERTADLKEAKRKAEESSAVKSDFLASLSHEVRTPMNAIVGFAKLLQMDECEKEERLEFAHLILESSSSMLNLIGDLLDTSRIERGVLPITIVDFDVFSDIADTYGLLSVENHNKHISFLLDESPALEGRVMTSDKDRLRQVIINLVYNAFKFTDQGFVKISVLPTTAADVKNSFSYAKTLAPETELLLVSVEDTGIGIPEDKLPLIFDPFRRLTPSKAKYGGMGLGLNLVKSIVTLLGGEVWVKSALGVGSTFSFYLPFKPLTTTQSDDASSQH